MKRSININPVISFMENLNKNYDFKSELILPFHYDTIKGVTTGMPITSINSLLVNIEEDLKKIDKKRFMNKGKKILLKNTLIHKNFLNILEEFKSACIRRNLPEIISVPILENPLAIRILIELVMSDILREIYNKGNNVAKKISSELLMAIDLEEFKNVHNDEEFNIKLLNLCVDTMASYLKSGK